MRILVLGASGFIGSAVCARLASDGHSLVRVSRGGSGIPTADDVRLDLATATPEQWASLLESADAVVNCAGVLQDSPFDSTAAVHERGAAALFAACERSNVRRVVHLSAAGVERGASAFSASKRSGEAILKASALDWFILRPSVVIGRGAYGGSALIRGLAALPILPQLPGTGPLQLVHLDDVVETILVCLDPRTPGRQVLELVGPRSWTFTQAVQLFRRWYRWPPARLLPLPSWAATALFRLGDLAALLGWRPPVRTTAQLEMVHGATGDPAAWRIATGIEPRDVESMLAREPASVQERWFARLYLLKPLIFGVFALFWIATGLISLGPGWEIGMDLMREGGVGETVGVLAVMSGALADICIGCAILYRPTSRLGLYAALIISLTYAVIGTILVPRLWRDPLGPMQKIWPVIVLNLVALAIREDR